MRDAGSKRAGIWVTEGHLCVHSMPSSLSLVRSTSLTVAPFSDCFSRLHVLGVASITACLYKSKPTTTCLPMHKSIQSFAAEACPCHSLAALREIHEVSAVQEIV